MDFKKLKRILNKTIERYNNKYASRANSYLAYAIKYYELNSEEISYLYSNFNKYVEKHSNDYGLEVNFTINSEVA